MVLFPKEKLFVQTAIALYPIAKLHNQRACVLYQRATLLFHIDHAYCQNAILALPTAFDLFQAAKDQSE